MKSKIIICTLVLMLSTFAVSSWAGSETDKYTLYGLIAGANTTGQHDTFIGYAAGYNNTIGEDNTFLGYNAGYNATASRNTFIGSSAGYNSSAIGNTFVGYQAGFTNTGVTSTYNTYVGNAAGYYANGVSNTFIGSLAGFHSTGNYNTFVGDSAGGGLNNATGSSNTIVGYQAGHNIYSGNNNTFLGYSAGYNNSTGTGNVFLGYNAGVNETGSNKLYIANSGTSTPLIYGEFDNSIVGINGNLGIGTQVPVRQVHLSGDNAVFRMDRTANSAAFIMVRTDPGSGNPLKTFVVGTNASGTNNGEFIINDLGTAVAGDGNRRMTIANDGTVTFTGNVFATAFNPSSITLKDHVRTYANALDTVNRLRGVSFDWKDSGKPSVGLIAEEVAKVVPEVVAYNGGAAAGVNYASLVGVLVEAVKEQQAIVKGQQNEVDSLKAEVRDKNSRLEQLEQRLLALEGK